MAHRANSPRDRRIVRVTRRARRCDGDRDSMNDRAGLTGVYGAGLKGTAVIGGRRRGPGALGAPVLGVPGAVGGAGYEGCGAYPAYPRWPRYPG